VVPRELVYPPDKSEADTDKENVEQFQTSQTKAEVAALRRLGYASRVLVQDVAAGAPADGKLKKGDVVTSVDGESVTLLQELTDKIRAKPGGTARTIGYTRDGQPSTVSVTTVNAADGKARIGVTVGVDVPHDFTIKIDLDKIGGPSAGLMFALGIVDKLTPEDLTGGLVVAGTGEIDYDGRVGPIGGIPQKLVAAKKAGATVFLTPESNCGEAVRNARPGLKLVKVGTLNQALDALRALREHREPPLCSAK